MAHEKILQISKRLGLRSSEEDIISSYKQSLENHHAQMSVAFQHTQPTPPPQHTENTEDFIHSESPIIETTISKHEALAIETIVAHPECITAQQLTEILDFIDNFEVKRLILWLKKIYYDVADLEYPLFIKQKMQEALPEEIKKVMA